MKHRLDQHLAEHGMVSTRSQAENIIKLGKVLVNKKIITKPGHVVSDSDTIKLTDNDQYVSRAALKLKSVAQTLQLRFQDAVVLDVGSSTGGFTEYALRHGAKKVFAVDVGTDQLHPTLRGNPNISLHEKTDIRNFQIPKTPDIVLIDVSFISIIFIAEAIVKNAGPKTTVIAMVKPQFEAQQAGKFHKGVIKNDRMRRDVFKYFELEIKKWFVIIDKMDSRVAGSKGNVERFYGLKLIR